MIVGRTGESGGAISFTERAHWLAAREPDYPAAMPSYDLRA
jgi:hypothetical protein